MNAFMIRGWRAWPAVVLVALGTGCSDALTGPSVLEPADLAATWQTADPASLGVDAAALQRAAEDAEELSRMRSLLVVRDGRLILERYFHGFARDSLADVRSATKSIVSTLAGIALERGDLPSLDQPIGDVLPASLGTLTAAQEPITFRHLLTMTGGFEWDESENIREYNDWILSEDHVAFLLDRPMVSTPGASFAYNSAAVYLLSVLLEEVVGRPLMDYADEYLFGPLGISERRWEELEDGRVNGGAGLDLRPRDLARLGQLMLQEGVSGDRQIVPASWVSLATTPAFTWSMQSGPMTDLSYGYLWWVDRTRDAFFAWGYGGQFIYVAPSRNLVIVATTEWRLLSQEGGPGRLTDAVQRIIVNGIVPAVPVG